MDKKIEKRRLKRTLFVGGNKNDGVLLLVALHNDT